jgi:ABC-type transport system involved in cytochrome c biogenesis permease subunit
MIIAFVAQLVMALMLAGLMGHIGAPSVMIGVISGALVWLGFVITTITVNNAFQKRNVSLTVIDGGHWLAVLALQGVVLGLVG